MRIAQPRMAQNQMGLGNFVFWLLGVLVYFIKHTLIWWKDSAVSPIGDTAHIVPVVNHVDNIQGSINDSIPVCFDCCFCS